MHNYKHTLFQFTTSKIFPSLRSKHIIHPLQTLCSKNRLLNKNSPKMKNQHPWTGPGSWLSRGGRAESPPWKEAPTRIIELADEGRPIWPMRLLLFPGGVCSGRSLLHSVQLVPFRPKPVYTRGSGAASHISRLIVSICRAPGIRQFRRWIGFGAETGRWSARKSRHYRGRGGGARLFVIFARDSPLGAVENCWYQDRMIDVARSDG